MQPRISFFGLSYLPGDMSSLSCSIERLASDSLLHDRMSQNASSFFNNYGDANKIYSEYVAHIETVAANLRLSINTAQYKLKTHGDEKYADPLWDYAINLRHGIKYIL